MVLFKQVQAVVLSLALAATGFVMTASAASMAAAAEPQNQQSLQTTQATASSAPSAEDFKQLVAPIALYPDALVGQVLAGATYPTEIVEAARWVQQNKNLKGDQLVAAVEKQPWDPSVKALSQFPSVLDNMSQNLSWTSALGDAYFNDPNSVMSAIQALRREAKAAGNLQSTPQQTVTSPDSQTIVIQPANPEVVYVPEYSPAVVYGEPIAAYPGYSGWDTAAASAISFGTGLFMGAAFSQPWGWGGWGANWHGGSVTYNRNNFVSRSNTFANRNTRFNQANVSNLNRSAANRNLGTQANRSINQFNRPTNRPGAMTQNRPVNRSALDQANRMTRDRQNVAASRGFGSADRGSVGNRSGAFGGYSQGGSARMNSARGNSSFSGSRGGGVSRGGSVSRGGGSRGGGGRGGGGRGGGGRGGGGGRR